MKKVMYSLFVLAVTIILVACAMNKSQNLENNTEVEPEMSQSYTIMTEKVETGNGEVHVAQIENFKGELLQDYMNQSLKDIINVYNNDSYSDVSIKYDIMKETDEILSVLYTGTATFAGEREIKIQHSVNLDLKTSNEISYANFVNNDQEVRNILNSKQEDFEAEGIRIYFKDENVVFFYMPLDDMATEFIEISLPREEIKDFINTTFGEIPAS